jgi:UDP-N-acetylglucosamine 2-epimerase (non-hydrolysing)
VRQSVEPVFAGHDRMFLVEPLNYVPFVYAMQNSYLVLTDSGGVQEEAPTLKKPVLVMRTNTERPEAVESGAARLVGINQDNIVAETRLLLENSEEYRKMISQNNPYGDGQSSKLIVQEIEKFFR